MLPITSTPDPEDSLCNQATRLKSRVLHMILGKLLNFSVLQFLICKNSNHNNDICIVGFKK